jgi:predicted SprT family Zn-dependent metalloprotease
MKKISDQLLPELEIIKNQVWTKYTGIFPAMKKFVVPSIIFNNRLKTCAGYCLVASNVIHINTRMFIANKPTFISDIIPHEIAHQIDFNIKQYDLESSKRIPWHGKHWQMIMIKYGIEPNMYHNLD